MKCYFAVVLIVMLSVMLDADASDPCDSGWSYYQKGNQCFRAIERRKSWIYAHYECHRMNGRLAIVPDAATHQFVSKMTSGNEFWIGLTDLLVEGDYTWTDGSSLSSVTQWGRGQPNNNAKKNIDQDCVLMDRDGKWNDASCCGTRAYFVCEKRGPGCLHMSGGCKGDCSESKDGSWPVKCSAKCKPGYGLENGNCYDIDECSFNNGDCEQECVNNIGSWDCTCYEGFRFNGTNCVVGDDQLIG